MCRLISVSISSDFGGPSSFKWPCSLPRARLFPPQCDSNGHISQEPPFHLQARSREPTSNVVTLKSAQDQSLRVPAIGGARALSGGPSLRLTRSVAPELQRFAFRNLICPRPQVIYHRYSWDRQGYAVDIVLDQEGYTLQLFSLIKEAIANLIE